MDALNWRKASYSASSGGGCAEVANHDGVILVRDTKNHGRGPVHRFSRAKWEAFTVGVRAGEFDLDESSRLP
jgi:hypothetical protein